MDDEQAVDAGASPGPETGLALGVGAVSAVVTLLALDPLLVNLEGPLGERAVLGRLTSLVIAVAVGAGLALLTRWVAIRSTARVAALLGGLVAVAVVAFPTQVDRHESFVERANERSACVGFSFRHYPPGTFDAASEVYCVGIERPRPAG